MIGDENVITNRGSIEGFGAAVTIEGTSNIITNYGTMDVSQIDTAFATTYVTVNIASVDGESNVLINHETISGADVAIQGGDGRDLIYNTGTIEGDINLGAGKDVISNAAGTIDGNIDLGDGDDQYNGGPGDYVNGVTGGSGDDTYFFKGHLTPVTEEVGGGTGDTVEVDVNATLAANVENLFLIGGEDITGRGNGLANQIVGNGGDNRLFGGGGADVFSGGFGADLMNGGGGADTADYEDSEEGVIVNLGKNIASGGTADGDKFAAVENLAGSAFKDILTGNKGANTFFGLGGGDKLDGGEGNDFLTGGGGLDTFVFAKGYNHDTVEDFFLGGASADKINLHAFKGTLNTVADVKSHMTNHGSDVDLTVGTDVLTIVGHQKGDFTTGDFIF